jgi:hypothetical protein
MKMKILTRTGVLLALLGLNAVSGELFSQDKSAGTIRIKRCVDFNIDGKGTSPQWNTTEWISLTQRTLKPVSYTTKAKVLYSENGIYFLFDCEDKKLLSTLKADNLDLYEEDVVEVFLWTKEDFPVYFEYELSPLNYELPIMVPNYKGSFHGWLPWHYEGDKRTHHETSVRGGKMESESDISAWVAEIFIPYKLLSPLPHVPPEPGTLWRANMYRIDYDQGMTPFSWQDTGPSFHEYQKFGTFVFE